ncbi:hypothetical protein FRX31_016914 [Thalictrum thalictroides]|uniref:Uncharacterized protein n=1 Tax=Thalictrum thalictroides TaxID=46969 RepID=A0A7J6W8D4_THATH|nr:hypothetical protein FRX31_016914 [Thalictrum thalictroides]
MFGKKTLSLAFKSSKVNKRNTSQAIPKSFMWNYLNGEKSTRKATLRTTKSGNSWKVSLKGLCFEDG